MAALKEMKMSVKFVIAFLTVSVLPLFVTGFISHDRTSKALSTQAFNQLNALQMTKKQQIEDYFQSMFLQMGIFAQSEDVKILYDRLVKYHIDTHVTATGNYDATTPEYREIWKYFGMKFRAYQAQSGVYDVFLICAKHGHVMYTNEKRDDLGENIGHGRYKETNLALLWKKIIRTGRPAVVDMAPYAPAGDKPAMFAGYPILHENGGLVGIIAFQIPLRQINDVMATRYGMGKTGITYLLGPDMLMRSDSPSSPQNLTVESGFTDPAAGKVDTKAAREALAGTGGYGIIEGFNGQMVLSSYSPLEIMDITWAVIAEIDVSEAFAPIKKLQFLMGIITLISITTIIFMALVFTRSMTRPILEGGRLCQSNGGR